MLNNRGWAPFSHLLELPKSLQKLFYGLFLHRVKKLGGDLRQRHQDEEPLREAWVGDGEGCGIDDLSSIEEEVNIYWAGGIGEAGPAAKLALDPLDEVEQLMGAKPG